MVGLSAVRNLLPSGERRTAIFDELLTAVIDRAHDGEFPATQVGVLLEGDSDNRTVALAAMVGNPSLVDGAVVLRSIHRPGSANEQCYALHAAAATTLLLLLALELAEHTGSAQFRTTIDTTPLLAGSIF